MDLGLKNKRAIVLAASKGLGKAAAESLAKEGCQLAICARNKDQLNQTKQALEALGVPVFARPVDVANSEALIQFLQQSNEQMGGVDILVTNAGGPPVKSFEETTEDEWQYWYGVTFMSVVHSIKTVLPYMKQQKWGRIINISSVVAFTGNPGQTNYAAAKAGIVGFSKALALEVASKNITVNVIAPGYIETDMTSALPEKVKEIFLNQIPLKRAGLPEEVAYLTAFLASEKANYITGCVFHINGGLYRG